MATDFAQLGAALDSKLAEFDAQLAAQAARVDAVDKRLDVLTKPAPQPEPEPEPAPLIVPGRPHSPHWDHARFSDFGRGHHWSSEPTKAVDRKWFAEHIDLYEAHAADMDTAMRGHNPTIEAFRYFLDQYEFVREWKETPDAYALHVSEPTVIRMRNKDGHEWTVNLAAGDRLQFCVWQDAYHAYNLRNPALRCWNIARLLAALDTPGMFLDAHAPDWKSLIGVSADQTVIVSGGGIVEYGGLNALSPEFATAYHQDMLSWLRDLTEAMKMAGKYVLINLAGWSLLPSGMEQITACNGAGLEFCCRPDQWAWPEQLFECVQMIDRVTDNGGVIDVESHWGYRWIMSREDWNYWRIAFYYLVKEMPGAPGRAFFNVMFSSSATIKPSQDPAEWLPCFQVDVGVPTERTKLLKTGKVRDVRYAIYARNYSKAFVIVRGRDGWEGTTRGDDTLVTVPLPASMRLLRADGTVGAPITEVQLRNGDSAILMK